MSKEKAQLFRVREIFPHAYHEAGHAVVGHVIGRLIEEVSIVPDRVRGYKGYCRCSAFMEAANDRFQRQEGSTNPEIGFTRTLRERKCGIIHVRTHLLIK